MSGLGGELSALARFLFLVWSWLMLRRLDLAPESAPPWFIEDEGWLYETASYGPLKSKRLRPRQFATPRRQVCSLQIVLGKPMRVAVRKAALAFCSRLDGRFVPTGAGLLDSPMNQSRHVPICRLRSANRCVNVEENTSSSKFQIVDSNLQNNCCYLSAMRIASGNLYTHVGGFPMPGWSRVPHGTRWLIKERTSSGIRTTSPNYRIPIYPCVTIPAEATCEFAL